MPQLEGRVFSRLKQYETLPDELKDELELLEDHLTMIQTQVFEKHHPKVIKSALGVKYKDLLEIIDEYLAAAEMHGLTASAQAKKAEEPRSDEAVTVKERAHHAKETLKDKVLGSARHRHHPAATRDDHVPGSRGFGATVGTDSILLEKPSAKSTAPGVAPTTFGDGHIHGTRGVAKPAPGSAPNANAKLNHAKRQVKATSPGRVGATVQRSHAMKLVQGLVLKGFITPYKEDDKVVNVPETFDFKDGDLFVPVAGPVGGLTEPATTVWDLVDGAIFAATIKRKANLLEKIKHGKDVYVVVNARGKTVTLFDSDVSRHCILQINTLTDSTHVEADTTVFNYGLMLSNATVTEMFAPRTRHERDAFVEALRTVNVTVLGGVAPGLTQELEKAKIADVVEETMDRGMHKQTDGQNAETGKEDRKREVSPSRHSDGYPRSRAEAAFLGLANPPGPEESTHSNSGYEGDDESQDSRKRDPARGFGGKMGDHQEAQKHDQGNSIKRESDSKQDNWRDNVSAP